MTLDEAREVFESMESPGDETVREQDWGADIQKLMDTVNSAVEAERERCAKIAERRRTAADYTQPWENGYDHACWDIIKGIRSGK